MTVIGTHQNGVEMKLAGEKEEKEAEKPNVVVEIKTFSDGRFSCEAKNGEGFPVGFMVARGILKTAAEHYEERFLMMLAENAARNLLEEAAKKGNRNQIFDFIRSLGGLRR